jgi:hypothetical protein
MITFVLVLIIGGQTVATDCADGALCFEDSDRCWYFAQRLNNRPEGLSIEARCEKQVVYNYRYAPIRL